MSWSEEILENRYRLVKDLFFASVDLEAHERDLFLVEVCQGDAALLTEIRSLIGSWSEDPGFLDRSPLFPMSLEDLGDAKPEGDAEPEGDAQPEASSPLDLRHLLAGWRRYSLESCLGTGGTSVVYRALDRRSQRRVAIKFLVHLGEGQLDRFQREAESLERIDHPGVLELFETGTVEGIPYLAMKLVAGTDLMGAREGTTVAERVELIRKVVLGLAAAHEQGVIHRDVKPSNILVERQDGELRPYLADFGIARDDEGEGVTRTGMLVGTPSYLAPERLQGTFGVFDHRSDIYALGVTFYEFLTGRRPHTSSSTLEMLFKIRDGEITLPCDAMPELPAGLEAILMKCLALEPEARYASAAALAEDLGQFLEGRPIVARPLGWISRGWRKVPRPRQMAAKMAAAGVALVTVALAVRLVVGEVSAPTSSAERPAPDAAGASALAGASAAAVPGTRSSATPPAPLESGSEDEKVPGLHDPEAARSYAKGRASLRQLDALRARVFFELAIEAQPDHPLVHAALSAAWRELGHDETARREAAHALARTAVLPEIQRLEVEAQYRAARAEWRQASEVYRQLRSSVPDEVEYGLRLAEVQTAAGLGAEALLTVGELVREAGPAGHDPRIDLAEATAAEATSDYERALVAAENAIRQAHELGAPLLAARGQLKKAQILLRVDDMEGALAITEEAKRAFAEAGNPSGMADALTLSGVALQSLGRLSEVLERSREAVGIYREIGHRHGMAVALNQIAIATFRLGADRAEARERVLEVLAVYQEIGNLRGIATSHNNVGLLILGAGDRAGAIEHYRQALAIQREIADREGTARTLNNLALALQQLNDLAGATEKHQESLAIKREIGDRSGVALSHLNLGHLHRLQGEPDEALHHYRQSFETSEAIDWNPGRMRALNGIGRIHYLRNELVEARRHQERALILNGETGAAFGVGQVALAQALLAGGRFEAAEATARASLASPGLEAQGRVLLAQALLRQGKTAEARSEMEQAEPLLQEGVNAANLTLKVNLARLQAALAGPAAARAARGAIESVLAEARVAGLQVVACEAELARAEIDLASQSQAFEARRRLESLIELTRARGLDLFTERAVALLEPESGASSRAVDG